MKNIWKYYPKSPYSLYIAIPFLPLSHNLMLFLFNWFLSVSFWFFTVFPPRPRVLLHFQLSQGYGLFGLYYHLIKLSHSIFIYRFFVMTLFICPDYEHCLLLDLHNPWSWHDEGGHSSTHLGTQLAWLRENLLKKVLKANSIQNNNLAK